MTQLSHDCAHHKKDIAGITDMKQLAEMIGDLHYETLAELFKEIGLKLARDAGNDCNNGRTELGMNLLDASLSTIKTYHSIMNAWKISKPFMQQDNERPPARPPA